MHLLTQLKKLLSARDPDVLYPCIHDLVENGLDTSRFAVNEQRPNRQDITQYIGAWYRSTGMPEEEIRDWMIQYCTTMLSSISSSSVSAIRHSTRSNLKYIYRSEVPFSCDADKNRFKAACSTSCPLYAEMSARFEEEKKRKEEALCRLVVQPAPEPVPTAKEIRRQEFEKSLSFIRTELNNGRIGRQIVQLLNQNGYKTRAGKEWTLSILSNEIGRLKIADP